MCAGVTSAAFLDAANEAAFSIKCLMKSSVACPTWQAKQHQLRCILCFLYGQPQSNVRLSPGINSPTHEDRRSLCDFADVIICLHNLFHSSSEGVRRLLGLHDNVPERP